MRAALVLLCGAWVLAPVDARALDKQGSAHGGKVDYDDHGSALTGSLLFGVAIYNPSYAARPDNSGHALLRVAPHFDFDIIGRHLSIPIDVNVFTDRDRVGVKMFLPSELDVITGVTSTWPLGEPTAIEFGARFERDMPVDRQTYTQSYADLRTRLLYSFAPIWRGLEQALDGGNLSGSCTLGWFAYNPSYAARPDNSGRALLRYGLGVNLDALHHHLGVGVDLTSFTDRRTNGVEPTELDLTPSVSYRLGRTQLQLAYERDMPIDRTHLVQQLVMAAATFDFRVFPGEPAEVK
ncbi:MAG TPA: hypothetical protein VFQ35_05280 [Polyangiaceae bacterium]|nr:hypothetical protein [Polyangiaceae bacterium]